MTLFYFHCAYLNGYLVFMPVDTSFLFKVVLETSLKQINLNRKGNGFKENT